MRITRVSTAVLESNFDWTIVKIETDEGITGYGEAFLGPGLTAVIREFAGILQGDENRMSVRGKTSYDWAFWRAERVSRA